MAARLALDAKDGLMATTCRHPGAIPVGYVVRDANDQALADSRIDRPGTASCRSRGAALVGSLIRRVENEINYCLQ
jgi:hypothetical protein